MRVLLMLLGTVSSASAFSPPALLHPHPSVSPRGNNHVPGQDFCCAPARVGGSPQGRSGNAAGLAMRAQDFSQFPRPESGLRGDFAAKIALLSNFIEGTFASQEKHFLRQLTMDQVMELKELLHVSDPLLGEVSELTEMTEPRAFNPFRSKAIAKRTISDEQFERLHCALMEAADLGDIGVIQSLLKTDEGRQVVMAADRSQHTALHVACIEGHLSVVKKLSEVGGKGLLLEQDNYGATALHFAAQRGRLEVVKHLAQVGGQELLVAEDRNGRTAAQLATYYGQPKVSEFLVKVKLEHDFGQ